MNIFTNNTLQRFVGSLVLLGVLLSVVSFTVPRTADAQGGSTVTCAIQAVAAAVGLKTGKDVAAAMGKIVAAARAKFYATEVPTGGYSSLAGEVTQPGGIVTTDTGTVFGKIYDNFKDTCLKQLSIDIGRLLIRQLRNMVINWINTGNFQTGQATFITNFEFDAKKTAENAARVFASELTGINFCNYFPINPALNLNFNLSLKAGLECTFRKTGAEYAAAARDPGLLTSDEQFLLRAQENDPLFTELAVREQMSRYVTKRAEARKQQVAAGRGFPGIEVCAEEHSGDGYYIDPISGSKCDNTGEAGPPEGCIYVAGQSSCKRYETKTPGSFIADLATEPLKSEFREVELIDEFGEALASIINALVGKVINEGLAKTFGR